MHSSSAVTNKVISGYSFPSARRREARDQCGGWWQSLAEEEFVFGVVMQIKSDTVSELRDQFNVSVRHILPKCFLPRRVSCHPVQ